MFDFRTCSYSIRTRVGWTLWLTPARGTHNSQTCRCAQTAARSRVFTVVDVGGDARGACLGLGALLQVNEAHVMHRACVLQHLERMPSSSRGPARRESLPIPCLSTTQPDSSKV